MMLCKINNETNDNNNIIGVSLLLNGNVFDLTVVDKNLMHKTPSPHI